MRLSSVIASSVALLASTAAAKDVACLVDGQTVAVVDLDTGVCPFTIPSQFPAPIFDFTSTSDYDILFYYSLLNDARYFTDIVNAGNIISIPAVALYGQSGAPLYQVHVNEEPASNSTAAIKKRLMMLRGLDISNNKNQDKAKRDAASDFAESLKTLDGTFLENSVFEVVDINPSSGASSIPSTESSGAAATETADESSAPLTIHSTTVSTETVDCSTSTFTTTDAEGNPSTGTTTVSQSTGAGAGAGEGKTVTEDLTTVVTITSCHDDLCHLTTVPGTQTVTTATVHGVETIYTTYCPLSDVETVESTKVITITSCHDNACHTSAVEATPAWTTETVGGTVTEYITYCPLTAGGKTVPAPAPTTVTKTLTGGEAGEGPVTVTIIEGGEAVTQGQVGTHVVPTGTTTWTEGASVYTSTVYETVEYTYGTQSTGAAAAATTEGAAGKAGETTTATTTEGAAGKAGETTTATTTEGAAGKAGETTVAAESQAAAAGTTTTGAAAPAGAASGAASGAAGASGETTVAVISTVAAESSSPSGAASTAINTYEGAASTTKATFFALAVAFVAAHL